jgi:hypothetical protein
MTLPSVFYKYAPASTILTVIETGRLRWSSPLLFNDQDEFQRMPRFEPPLAESMSTLVHFFVDVAFDSRDVDETRLSTNSRVLLAGIRLLRSSGEGRESLLAELDYNAIGADERFGSLVRATFDVFGLDTARVLCVTTEPDNELMWAKYAKSHSGAVIGLQHVPRLDTPLLAAGPVAYSASPPIVGSGLDYLLYGVTRELKEKTLEAVCFTKSTDWAYEREWRVVTWRPAEVGAQHGDYRFDRDELHCVTLGSRIDRGAESRIRACLRSDYPNARVFRIATRDGVAVREDA